MGNPIIVLVTKGKTTEVDFVEVHLCANISEANSFMELVNEKINEKYWEEARIIQNAKEYELISPWGNDL